VSTFLARTAAAIGFICLGLLASTSASAALTYNYSQDWLYDSSSGLYWQVQPVSTATFVPQTGSLATVDQLDQLSVDMGIPNGVAQAAYSQNIANVVSFFQSDTPAGASASSQPNLQVSALYLEGIYLALPNYVDEPDYEYESMSYAAVTGSGTPTEPLWLYQSISTVGSYGPGNPCPNESHICPASEPGFVVSTVPPVPLPASGTLLMLGICVLTLATMSRRAPAAWRATAG
jgi:hypothetical protein